MNIYEWDQRLSQIRRLKTHAVKRENIMIQRENKLPNDDQTLLEQVEQTSF